MAADTQCSPLFADLEGKYSKDNDGVSVVKDENSDNDNELKQTVNGKPPRHLSVVRHSVSTTTLFSSTDLLVSSLFRDYWILFR